VPADGGEFATGDGDRQSGAVGVHLTAVPLARWVNGWMVRVRGRRPQVHCMIPLNTLFG